MLRRLCVRDIVVGFQGLAAGLAHMHAKGMVDQAIHAANVLCSLDNATWVKADLGSAVWAPQDGKPSRVHHAM